MLMEPSYANCQNNKTQIIFGSFFFRFFVFLCDFFSFRFFLLIKNVQIYMDLFCFCFVFSVCVLFNMYTYMYNNNTFNVV